MAEIRVEKQFAHSAAEVWKRIEDPATVAQWIPAIATSRVDGDIRHVTFADGAPARERIVDHRGEQRRYTYQYIDGPLALDRYESTIAVTESADGTSIVTWSAEFAAASAELEAELATAIEAIYTGALDELAARLASS